MRLSQRELILALATGTVLLFGMSAILSKSKIEEWKDVTKTWRCPIETMRQYEKDNRLYYTKNGVPRIKRFVDDVPGGRTDHGGVGGYLRQRGTAGNSVH